MLLALIVTEFLCCLPQVFIIGLLAVEKYENFRPVLDTYCDKLFHAATVHTYIIDRSVFKYVVYN